MVKKMSTFDFEWKVMCGLRRVKDYMEQALQPFCARHGVTPIQLRILMALAHGGPQTMSALAKGSCIAGTNLSALCKNLAAVGLIERRRDDDDERQVLVKLSDEGGAVIEALGREFEHGSLSACMHANKRDMDLVLAGLDRLLNIMETSEEKAS